MHKKNVHCNCEISAKYVFLQANVLCFSLWSKSWMQRKTSSTFMLLSGWIWRKSTWKMHGEKIKSWIKISTEFFALKGNIQACFHSPVIIDINSSKSTVPEQSSSTSSIIWSRLSSLRVLSISRRISFRTSVVMYPLPEQKYRN